MNTLLIALVRVKKIRSRSVVETIKTNYNLNFVMARSRSGVIMPYRVEKQLIKNSFVEYNERNF